MLRIFAALGILFAAGASWGQAPAPTAPSGTASSTIDADKGKSATSQQRRTRGELDARPGATPAPMHIRIQDSGVKLPKCAAESREGEACKQ